MKIENINDDIIKDTIEIREKLEEKIRRAHPGIDFTISLPGITGLSAIKVIEFSFIEENIIHSWCVDLHTHNGNRVFEHAPASLKNGSAERHPLQDSFIAILREVIKKRKTQIKSTYRPANLYNEIKHGTGMML
jgi:hypothetical protein